MIAVERLELEDWQQFRTVSLEFHPRLTMLTGSNGSGKSTVLRFFSRHWGWGYTQAALPFADSKRPGWFRLLFRRRESPPAGQAKIGRLRYSNGQESIITVPVEQQGATYQPNMQSMQGIEGLYLSSHRPEFVYSQISQMNLQPTYGEAAFQTLNSQLQQRTFGGGGQPVAAGMKQTLLSLSIFGHGNPDMPADSKSMDLFNGFQEVLRTILPPEIGFERITFQAKTEIVLQTKSGPFILEAVSGGVGALIILAWQLFMFSDTHPDGFTAVIDEPENHLHPKMQRTVMPSLLRAFPKTRFVIATHSPLIIGSVREASVYALRFDGDRRVFSEQLDLSTRSGSAIQVLHEVLGLEFTRPVWVEEELNQILPRLKSARTAEELQQVRKQLADNGLDSWFPELVEGRQ